MPFQFSAQKTASGMPYLRVDVSGYVELADAELMVAELQKPEFHGGMVLSVVAKGVEYSPQVRKFFPTMVDKYKAIGVVVTSAIVRAAINLMIRLAPASGGTARMFGTEAEALKWLEDQS